MNKSRKTTKHFLPKETAPSKPVSRLKSWLGEPKTVLTFALIFGLGGAIMYGLSEIVHMPETIP